MLQNSSMLATFGVFLSSPTKTFYLMEISKKIGLAHTSVKKNIEELKKEGLILESIEKKGKRRYPIYTANRDSNEFRKHKRLFNYQALLESGIVEFIEERVMPRCIVLFGSFQRGEDIEDSDIDLFVECTQTEIDVSSFKKKLNRRIQLHFNERFDSYPAELKNNIVNGVVLYGFLEAY